MKINYKYVGGGYFRHKELPKYDTSQKHGDKAFQKKKEEIEERGEEIILHGQQLIEYIEGL